MLVGFREDYVLVCRGNSCCFGIEVIDIRAINAGHCAVLSFAIRCVSPRRGGFCAGTSLFSGIFPITTILIEVYIDGTPPKRIIEVDHTLAGVHGGQRTIKDGGIADGSSTCMGGITNRTARARDTISQYPVMEGVSRDRRSGDRGCRDRFSFFLFGRPNRCVAALIEDGNGELIRYRNRFVKGIELCATTRRRARAEYSADGIVTGS